MIHVLVLEPDYWRRRGIASVIREWRETIKLIGEEDGVPHVVLLAHRLFEERGRPIIKCYGRSVLVYGEDQSADAAAQMYRAGAAGYLLMQCEPALLRRAIEVVSSGRFWGPRESLELLVQRNRADGAIDSQQLAVLRLLNEGLTNKEIGQRLGLAEATIKARMNRLYKRFGVATRLQLLTAALRSGVVEVRREG